MGQFDPTPSPAAVDAPTEAPLYPGTTRAPQATPAPIPTPAPSGAAPSVQGVLRMSDTALLNCEEGCAAGLGEAFDVEEYLVSLFSFCFLALRDGSF